MKSKGRYTKLLDNVPTIKNMADSWDMPSMEPKYNPYKWEDQFVPKKRFDPYPGNLARSARKTLHTGPAQSDELTEKQLNKLITSLKKRGYSQAKAMGIANRARELSRKYMNDPWNTGKASKIWGNMDFDGDGVKNKDDCYPFDYDRQDFWGDFSTGLGNLFSGQGYKYPVGTNTGSNMQGDTFTQTRYSDGSLGPMVWTRRQSTQGSVSGSVTTRTTGSTGTTTTPMYLPGTRLINPNWVNENRQRIAAAQQSTTRSLFQEPGQTESLTIVVPYDPNAEQIYSERDGVRYVKSKDSQGRFSEEKVVPKEVISTENIFAPDKFDESSFKTYTENLKYSKMNDPELNKLSDEEIAKFQQKYISAKRSIDNRLLKSQKRAAFIKSPGTAWNARTSALASNVLQSKYNVLEGQFGKEKGAFLAVETKKREELAKAEAEKKRSEFWIKGQQTGTKFKYNYGQDAVWDFRTNRWTVNGKDAGSGATPNI